MKNKYLTFLFTSSIITACCSIYPALGQGTTASEITFTCEDNNGTPITVARHKTGQTQTVFHWKEEILADKTQFTTQELCSDVSEKLNNYSNNHLIKAHDIYSFNLVGAEEFGMPLICITTDGNCNRVLLALSSSPEKRGETIAFETLEAILNPNIIIYQKDNCRYRDCFSSALFTIIINLFQNQ